MQLGVVHCPICASLCGPLESASEPMTWEVLGCGGDGQLSQELRGAFTNLQAPRRRITITITRIYMLKSCLPQQSDKYLKILYIIGSILFLIYKANYLY